MVREGVHTRLRSVLQHRAVFTPGSEFKFQECSTAENPEQETSVKWLTVLSHCVVVRQWDTASSHPIYGTTIITCGCGVSTYRLIGV